MFITDEAPIKFKQVIEIVKEIEASYSSYRPASQRYPQQRVRQALSDQRSEFVSDNFRNTCRRAVALDGITCEVWSHLSQRQKDWLRDPSQLSPQLIGKEGWLVRVWDDLDRKPRMFIIGVSTGWRPIHLEIPNNSRSRAGAPASRHYARIEFLKFKR